MTRERTDGSGLSDRTVCLALHGQRDYYTILGHRSGQMGERRKYKEARPGPRRWCSREPFFLISLVCASISLCSGFDPGVSGGGNGPKRSQISGQFL